MTKVITNPVMLNVCNNECKKYSFVYF